VKEDAPVAAPKKEEDKKLDSKQIETERQRRQEAKHQLQEHQNAGFIFKVGQQLSNFMQNLFSFAQK
jgi:hypothetical protein